MRKTRNRGCQCSKDDDGDRDSVRGNDEDRQYALEQRRRKIFNIELPAWPRRGFQKAVEQALQEPWRTGPAIISKMEILVHLWREMPPDYLE